MHVTVTIAYNDLSVTASTTADYDQWPGQTFNEMANRATAALANTYETLVLATERISDE